MFLKIIQIQFSHLQKAGSRDEVQIQTYFLICFWNRNDVYFQVQAQVMKRHLWDVHSGDVLVFVFVFFLNFLQDFEIFSNSARWPLVFPLGCLQMPLLKFCLPAWEQTVALSFGLDDSLSFCGSRVDVTDGWDCGTQITPGKPSLPKAQ